MSTPFVGFAPAFNQAFQQRQRGRQAQQLQGQQGEARLAELQKRFELQQQQPTAQQRQAEAFATDPNIRQLLEFQADPLGQKERGLDIQQQGLEARLQALSPEGRRPTSQIQNFNFLLQREIEGFRRTKGKEPNATDLEKLTKTARDIAFKEGPLAALIRSSIGGGGNQPQPLPTGQQ